MPTGVEVRISREEIQPFLGGGEGGAELSRRGAIVTQAISAVVRAPDGDFTIETLGPETQWIFPASGAAREEPFGRWNWSVTPTESGRHSLQLVIAVRSIHEDGMASDTVLPDQMITVLVRAAYLRGAGRVFRWVLWMALGGAITEAGLALLRLAGGSS